MINSKQRNILIYGLSIEQKERLYRRLPFCIFRDAEYWQDLIALKADFVIINPTALCMDEKEVIGQYYRGFASEDECIILTEQCPQLDNIKNVQYLNMFLNQNCV